MGNSRRRSNAAGWLGALAGVCLLLGTAGPAHAVLISTDWQSYGDGLLTLDTDTGLEWLDLTVTQNRSWMDLFPELSDYDSDLYGFQSATSDDWFAFVQHAGFSPEQTRAERFESAFNVLSLTGITLISVTGDPVGSEGDIFGSVGMRNANQFMYEECLSGTCFPDINSTIVSVLDNPLGGRFDSYANFSPDQRIPYAGFYLYRAAQVPEASTSMLVAMGMLLLSASRRLRER